MMKKYQNLICHNETGCDYLENEFRQRREQTHRVNSGASKCFIIGKMRRNPKMRLVRNGHGTKWHVCEYQEEAQKEGSVELCHQVQTG